MRLGAVSYLNAAPLVHGLPADDTRLRVERHVPAELAERLHRGAVDVGLIPVIEYATGRGPTGGYAIVPGIAIACRGDVRSVCLFHRGASLGAPRRVALDTSSRTSVALAKVLLHEQLGHAPEYVPMAPDPDAMLAECDAALVIGDRALDCDRPGVDLGRVWLERTGLPFVFAFWAGRPDALTRDDVRRLHEARRAGLAGVHAIADAFAAGDPSRRARYAEYLRRHIVFELGPREIEGLREFYRRAHALGLIPNVPELRFYDDP